MTFRFERAVVNVCGYCKSVVARTDRGLADIGKVSDLVESESPLSVGMSGAYLGVPFTLSGRAQLKHPAGGVWDEWYAAFADGRWGWLAEAQGRFYITFEALPHAKLPAFESIAPGATLTGVTDAMTPFVVAEKNVAALAGALGEIPYRLEPGARVRYCDLSARDGEFATIDYDEHEADLYAGREVTLADLGLDAAKKKETHAARAHAASAALACPKCGGRLELKAPDATMRVTCPYCRALIDVRDGALQYLTTIDADEKPAIPLGSTATFDGHEMVVIGWMVRGVMADGIRYPWAEYLLYAKNVGFRWLVEANGHWTFVAPINAGEVSRSSKTAMLDGKTFDRFSFGIAAVEHVEGEFYWRVQAGEEVKSEDFVAPPRMLSLEESKDEVNWSIGTYVAKGEIAKKFPKATLPRQVGVAPNQPAPGDGYGKVFAIFAALVFLLGITQCVRAHGTPVFSQDFKLAAQKSADDGQVVFTDAFHLASMQNVGVEVQVPKLENSWAHVSGDIVDQATGLVQSFDVPVEYYAGVEDGESWSEGSRSANVVLSSLPEGQYSMRLELFRESWAKADGTTMTVTVTEGISRPTHTGTALFAVFAGAFGVFLVRRSFEKRRWENSDED
jgi:hypothetical protein